MMNRILRGGIVSVSLLALSLGACKGEDKKPDPKPEPAPAAQPTAKATPTPAPTPEPAPVPAPVAATTDFFHVEISHAEPKPTDPVIVKFADVKVTTSSIDLSKMEEASAELTINMAAIDSGIPKRDGHLATPDYLDTAAFANATVKVSGVKAKEGDTYTAKSEVTVHGLSKTWDVEFKVVEKSATEITIEASHDFSRVDFEIGKAEGDTVSTKATGKLRITLPLSS